jgi:predicted RNase H-like HicB family nuclease
VYIATVSDPEGDPPDRVEFIHEDDGRVTARHVESGVAFFGDTEAEALRQLADALDSHFGAGEEVDDPEAYLADRDVGRAYLIQDAEQPTSDIDDRDRLTLQQFGDGVRGAVRTTAYLDSHGLEARVAELPRPGLEKVDLNDYLQGWSDDLTPAGVYGRSRPSASGLDPEAVHVFDWQTMGPSPD